METQHDSVVVSQVNLTLASMEQSDNKPQIQSEQLVDVGNLVYSYDVPSDPKNGLRPKKDSSEEREEEDANNDYERYARRSSRNRYQADEYDEETYGPLAPNYGQNKQQMKSRSPRSVKNQISRGNHENSRRNNNNQDQDDSEVYSGEKDEDKTKPTKEYYQPKPTLKYAPENPLLNYFIGNKGGSIQNSKQFNAPAQVQSLVEEISADLEDANEMPIKNTLRKFNILAKVIRTMNAEQIEKTTRLIEEKDNQRSMTRKVYRDALVSAGTGPAVSEMMKWIEEERMTGEEAAEVIAAFPKTIREPTEQMLQRFFVSIQIHAYTHEMFEFWIF